MYALAHVALQISFQKKKIYVWVSSPQMDSREILSLAVFFWSY